jgi:hypothetical protein
VDEFEFFFTFYGLILGLAAAEVLSSIATFARARPLREMEAQTGLLTLLTFVLVCTTWIDAWRVRDTFSIDIAGMVLPILIAGSYYLAASTAFPREAADFADLDGYYARRKRFAVMMLIVAEICVTITYVPSFIRTFTTQPAVFWLYHLPYNFAIKFCLVALFLVAARRANIALLIALILLFTIPYWSGGWIGAQIARAHGYVV